MNKHTQAKWRLTDEEKSAFVYALNKDGVNVFSAAVQGGYSDDGKRTNQDELHANARLIAAAPDLLEACAALVEGMEASGITGEYLTAARAAIAKATGGAA